MLRKSFKSLLMLSICITIFSGSVQAQNITATPITTDGLPVAQVKKQAVVYFTRDISPEGLQKIYRKVKGNIKGKVAIKIHTGEPHGPNILPKNMVKALQQSVPNSNLVETNTFYRGSHRNTTADHRETLQINGWTFCPVDILDEVGNVMLPVKGGKHFTEMSMGKNIENYDSMLVLTHFKGHSMGGFGGSIKNIAIGCADAKTGKAMIHNGDTGKRMGVRKGPLMENMVESAKATVDHFGKHIVFINVLRNMSVDCDCAGVKAAKPVISDIGILASKDILAVDQASVDMVYAEPDKESHDLKERIASREGLRQLSYGEEMGLGNRHYRIVDLDKK